MTRCARSSNVPSSGADDPILAATLERLWSPPVAVTAADGGRANGLIASTAVTASLLPEAPRVALILAKASFTHDLVLASDALALHLLAAIPDSALARSLEIFRVLGMRSGHDGEKLETIPYRPGVTGSPILEEALSYVEARVATSLDGGDVTVVVADVVAGEVLRDGTPLTIDVVRDRLPGEWLREWEERRVREITEARLRRASA